MQKIIFNIIYIPNCKNDKTRFYKGTEPSPKGLGYCAHAEKYVLLEKDK